MIRASSHKTEENCVVHRPLAEALLENVSSVKGIWIATLAEIAAYHNNSVNKGSFGESAEIPSLPDGYF